MHLSKNAALLLAAIGIRLGLGVISIAFVARSLGPTTFGQFSLYIGIGAVTSNLAGFGLPIFIMKEYGSTQTNLQQKLIYNSLNARLISTLISLLFVLCVTIFFFQNKDIIILTILVIGVLCEGTLEQYYSIFRAKGNYHTETRISIYSATLNSAATILAAQNTSSLQIVALAFALTRIASLIYIHTTYTQTSEPHNFSLKEGFETLRCARAYAAENYLSGLFGSIDSLAISARCTIDQAGTYQAGMRIFWAAFQVAPIFTNIFIPELSRENQPNNRRYKEVAKQCIITCNAIALIGGCALYFAAPTISIVLYGAEFASTALLMPLFGLLFFLKIAAASWGIILTTKNEQNFKAKINLAHWILVGAVFFNAHPTARSWLISLIAGTALQLIFLASRCAIKNYYNRFHTLAFVLPPLASLLLTAALIS